MDPSAPVRFQAGEKCIQPLGALEPLHPAGSCGEERWYPYHTGPSRPNPLLSNGVQKAVHVQGRLRLAAVEVVLLGDLHEHVDPPDVSPLHEMRFEECTVYPGEATLLPRVERELVSLSASRNEVGSMEWDIELSGQRLHFFVEAAPRLGGRIGSCRGGRSDLERDVFELFWRSGEGPFQEERVEEVGSRVHVVEKKVDEGWGHG